MDPDEEREGYAVRCQTDSIQGIVLGRNEAGNGDRRGCNRMLRWGIE